MALTPNLGPPGSVVQLRGAGFPSAINKIGTSWDRGIESFTPIAVSNGAFAVPLVILPHDLPGPRKLQLTTQQVGGADVSCAMATFLVLPGALQPDNFVVRR